MDHARQLARFGEEAERILKELPAGADRFEPLVAVAERLGIAAPDHFVSTFLTAQDGGDIQLAPKDRDS